MKKLVTLLIAIFVLSFIVVLAIPVSAATVSNVEITNVHEPIPGGVTHTFAYVKSAGCALSDFNRNGFTKGTAWYDITKGKMLSPGEKAIEGHIYRFYAYLEVKSGNKFSVSGGYSTVNATIDGMTATVVNIGASGYRNSDTEILVYCDFPKCTTRKIKNVDAAVTLPKAEEHPNFTVKTGYGYDDDYYVDDSYNYSGFVNGVKWTSVSENDRVMDDTDRFIYGNTYRINIRFAANTGREFNLLPSTAIDVTAKINGNKAYAIRSSTYDSKQYIEVFCEFKIGVNTLNELSLTGLSEPEDGAFAKIDCAPNDTTFSIKSSKWTDYASGSTLSSSNKFIENKKYKLTVELVAKNGCELSTETIATVNGRTMDLTYLSKTSLTAEYIFTAGPSKTISSVNLTWIDDPISGHSNKYYAIVEPSDKCSIDTSLDDGNKYYIKNGVQWLCGDNIMQFKDTITGGSYTVCVFIKAKPGFEFEHDAFNTITASATYKGKSGAVVNCDFVSTTEAWVTYTFPTLPNEIVYGAGVGIYYPNVGENPRYFITNHSSDDFYLSERTGGNVKNGICWIDLTTGKPLKPTDTFIAGHAYRVTVECVPMEGCEFYTGSLKCTIDDKPCGYIGGELQKDIITLYRDYDPLPGGDEKINRVTLYGDLAYGVTLSSGSFTSTDAGIASVVTEWENDGKTVPEGTKAVPGTYMPYITLKAAPGYVFADNVVIVIFGSEYSSVWTGDLGKTAMVNTGPLTVGTCDHAFYKMEYDQYSHWCVCLSCFEVFNDGMHTFDEGHMEGSAFVKTCTVCGYQEKNDTKLTVVLPGLDFPMTYEDVCKNTKVSISGNNKPLSIVFTFESKEDPETIIYDAASGNWSLPGGGDLAKAFARKCAPFEEYNLSVQVVSGIYFIDQLVDVTNTDNRATDIDKDFTENSVIVRARYITSGNLLSTIPIEGVSAPVPGQKPSKDFKIGLDFGFEPVSIEWNAGETFECDKVYTATVKVKISDDYLFAAETTAMVDGCDDVQLDIDGSTATLICTYPKTEHKFGADGKCEYCNQAKPGTDTDKPATDKPVTDTPVTDKPSTDTPAPGSDPVVTTPAKTGDDTTDNDKDSSNNVILIILAVAAVIALGAAVTAFVMIKKRNGK